MRRGCRELARRRYHRWCLLISYRTKEGKKGLRVIENPFTLTHLKDPITMVTLESTMIDEDLKRGEEDEGSSPTINEERERGGEFLRGNLHDLLPTMISAVIIKKRGFYENLTKTPH